MFLIKELMKKREAFPVLKEVRKVVESAVRCKI